MSCVFTIVIKTSMHTTLKSPRRAWNESSVRPKTRSSATEVGRKSAKHLEDAGAWSRGERKFTIHRNILLTYAVHVKNTDVTDGHVNGMVGTLMEIEHDVDVTLKRAWLMCPPNVGVTVKAKVSCRLGVRRYAKWVPIHPQTLTFALKNYLKHVLVRRTQFPLVPASAMTIHKAQGGTFDTIVYEYSKAQKLVYVALSRVSSLQGLYLTNGEQYHRFHHCMRNVDKPLAT